GRLMLTVLGGLAEFERELIRARTGEGRKRAKERGVRFGRPRKLTPHQREEALQRLAAGETQADVARTYNVDPTTIGRRNDRYRCRIRLRQDRPDDSSPAILYVHSDAWRAGLGARAGEPHRHLRSALQTCNRDFPGIRALSCPEETRCNTACLLL